MGATGPPATGEVIVDSDVLIWYLRGKQSARNFVDPIKRSQRVLSSVVRMELVRGCRDQTELRRLRRFFQSGFGNVAHISEDISRRAVTLIERYSLSHDMAVDDALIASTALITKAALATANVRDYQFIPGLKLLPFGP